MSEQSLSPTRVPLSSPCLSCPRLLSTTGSPLHCRRQRAPAPGSLHLTSLRCWTSPCPARPRTCSHRGSLPRTSATPSLRLPSAPASTVRSRLPRSAFLGSVPVRTGGPDLPLTSHLSVCQTFRVCSHPDLTSAYQAPAAYMAVPAEAAQVDEVWVRPTAVLVELLLALNRQRAGPQGPSSP